MMVLHGFNNYGNRDFGRFIWIRLALRGWESTGNGVRN
jgi:hypothetical protein